MSEFAKEMHFEEEPLGKKSVGGISLKKVLQSPANKAGSLKRKSFSKLIKRKTRFLSSNPNQLCDILNLLLQEKKVAIFLT